MPVLGAAMVTLGLNNTSFMAGIAASKSALSGLSAESGVVGRPMRPESTWPSSNRPPREAPESQPAMAAANPAGKPSAWSRLAYSASGRFR